MSRDRSASMWQSHKVVLGVGQARNTYAVGRCDIEISGGRLVKAVLGKLQAMPKQGNAIPWQQGRSGWR